ncbi:hypothetical protein AB1I63_02120 [Streptococcus pneumoniae]
MRKRFFPGEEIFFFYHLSSAIALYRWRTFSPVKQEVFYWLGGGLLLTFLMTLLGYFFYPRWKWSIWHLFFFLVGVYLLIFGTYSLIFEKIIQLASSPEDISNLQSYQTTSLWSYPMAMIGTLTGYHNMMKQAIAPQEDSLFGIKNLKK